MQYALRPVYLHEFKYAPGVTFVVLPEHFKPHELVSWILFLLLLFLPSRLPSPCFKQLAKNVVAGMAPKSFHPSLQSLYRNSSGGLETLAGTWNDLYTHRSTSHLEMEASSLVCHVTFL